MSKLYPDSDISCLYLGYYMIITALCVSVGSVFRLCPLGSPAFNNYQEDQM